MLDITDLFGKNRIKSLKYELKRQKCDMQGEIDRYREQALETAHTCHYLAEIMERNYKALKTMTAERDRLAQMLRVCEDARKGLGEKNRELNSQNEALDARFRQMTDRQDELQDKLRAREQELEELYKEHEALVRELRDSQHGRTDDDTGEEAMSA